MTDNTYSLACSQQVSCGLYRGDVASGSPSAKGVQQNARNTGEKSQTTPEERSDRQSELEQRFGGKQEPVNVGEASNQDAVQTAGKQSYSELESELAEARSLLDAISNSTEHADAAQKWETEKAELLLTLQYLLDEIRRLCEMSTLRFERVRTRYSYTNAERVIAKYEATK